MKLKTIIFFVMLVFITGYLESASTSTFYTSQQIDNYESDKQNEARKVIISTAGGNIPVVISSGVISDSRYFGKISTGTSGVLTGTGTVVITSSSTEISFYNYGLGFSTVTIKGFFTDLLAPNITDTIPFSVPTILEFDYDISSGNMLIYRSIEIK